MVALLNLIGNSDSSIAPILFIFLSLFLFGIFVSEAIVLDVSVPEMVKLPETERDTQFLINIHITCKMKVQIEYKCQIETMFHIYMLTKTK